LQNLILGAVAFFMLASISSTYKLARRARALRNMMPSVLAPWPELGEPERYALFGLARQVLPQDKQPANIGKRMLLLHEAAAATSPGWLATLFFLFVYGGTFFLLLAFGVVVAIQVEGRKQTEAVAEARMVSDEVDSILAQCRRLEAEGGNAVVVQRMKGEANEKIDSAQLKLMNEMKGNLSPAANEVSQRLMRQKVEALGQR